MQAFAGEAWLTPTPSAPPSLCASHVPRYPVEDLGRKTLHRLRRSCREATDGAFGPLQVLDEHHARRSLQRPTHGHVELEAAGQLQLNLLAAAEAGHQQDLATAI